MAVRVENQEYYDWASPMSDGQFEGKNARYASLDMVVNDDGDLEVYLRKKANLKTDFTFTMSESDAKKLYEMLHDHFGE